MTELEVVEFFAVKLRKLQETYDNLQESYQAMIGEHERLIIDYRKLEQDYDYCATDLKSTRLELDNATRLGFRNQHGSYSYPFGENN